MKFVAGFVVGATAALLFETLLAFVVLAIAAALALALAREALDWFRPAPVLRKTIWISL